jgi:hypothetical protein
MQGSAKPLSLGHPPIAVSIRRRRTALPQRRNPLRSRAFDRRTPQPFYFQ